MFCPQFLFDSQHDVVKFLKKKKGETGFGKLKVYACSIQATRILVSGERNPVQTTVSSVVDF